MSKNYYDILGIDKNASVEDIKKSYRKLAKEYHPDKNKGEDAASKFQEIQEAYETLSDLDKKAKYDNKGSRSYDPHSGFWGKMWSEVNVEPDPVFNNYTDAFNRSYGSQWSQKGRSLTTNLSITLDEAFNGTTKQVYGKDNVPVSVTINPGIKDGYRLIVRGAGMRGAVEDGDLYVTIRIIEHPTFERIDNDLHCVLEIDLYTAILGGDAYLDIFGSIIKIAIPESTQNGKVMRIQGKGMPVYTNSAKRGSLFFEIKVNVPTNLSVGEKDLFKMLRDFTR